MSENLHPEVHLDADLLSAFIEGALPEHEREQCLRHLGNCAECRAVAFLGQEPVAEAAAPVPPIVKPATAWRRWFVPVSAVAVAALALFGFFALRKTPNAVSPPLVAVSKESAAAQVDTGPVAVEKQMAKMQAEDRPVRKREAPAAKPVAEDTRAEAPVAATTPPPAEVLTAPARVPVPSPPPAARIAQSGVNAGASVAGMVTDSTGAAVSGATVTVRQSGSTSNTTTDASGRYEIAGLPAGQYQMQFAAPGFSSSTQQLAIEAGARTTADSTLQVGAVSETVQVEAASATVVTRAADLPLSIKAAVAAPSTTVSSGKFLVRLDADGGVFVSSNSGKS
jgi:hypothetical protein